MKRILFGILLLSALVPLGCESYIDPTLDEDPDISGFVYAPGPRSFAPRDVNYVWAIPIRSCLDNNLFISITTFNQLIEKNKLPECYVDNWMNIDTAIPALEENHKKRSAHYDYVWFISHEEMIEHVRTYREKHPDILVEGPVLPDLVEYRTEGVAEVKITSDQSLFGKEPGESLNEYFAVDYRQDAVYGGCYSYADFTELRYFEKGIPLSDWLACKPLFPQSFCFFSEDVVSEENINHTTITVEIATTTGKRFRASHKICPDVLPAVGREENEIYQPEFLAARVEN